MFQNKIVQIDSDDTDNFDLLAIEKYVLDIFKLARSLLKKEEVETLEISEIIKKVCVSKLFLSLISIEYIQFPLFLIFALYFNISGQKY